LLAVISLTNDSSCITTFELTAQAGKKLQTWKLDDAFIPQNIFILDKRFLLVAGHIQEDKDVNAIACTSIYTPNIFESSSDTVLKMGTDIISFSNSDYPEWPEDLRFSLGRVKEQ